MLDSAIKLVTDGRSWDHSCRGHSGQYDIEKWRGLCPICDAGACAGVTNWTKSSEEEVAQKLMRQLKPTSTADWRAKRPPSQGQDAGFTNRHIALYQPLCRLAYCA